MLDKDLDLESAKIFSFEIFISQFSTLVRLLKMVELYFSELEIEFYAITIISAESK